MHPTSENTPESQGHEIVALHLSADEKFGKMSATVIAITGLISIYINSFLPVILGVIFSFLASYFIRYSCYRHIENTTGMSREGQFNFVQRYKTDKQFADEVDQLYERAVKRMIAADRADKRRSG